MIKRAFIRGLVTIVPLVVTVSLLIWFFERIEALFGKWIIGLVGPEYYFDGLGFIVGLVVTFLVGIIMSAFFMQRLYRMGERLVSRIPVINSLYGALRDLMNFFDSLKENNGKKVVTFEVGGVHLLGLITREHFDDVMRLGNMEEVVSVYVPLSYQIGGLMMLISKSKLQPVEVPVEVAMRFAVTAGMFTKKQDEEPFSWRIWKRN